MDLKSYIIRWEGFDGGNHSEGLGYMIPRLSPFFQYGIRIVRQYSFGEQSIFKP
jgi:hypothetical protein